MYGLNEPFVSNRHKVKLTPGSQKKGKGKNSDSFNFFQKPLRDALHCSQNQQ